MKLHLLIISLLVAACGGNESGPESESASSSLSVLHAERGANAGIYDAEGRRVLLRGVNYSALGDYYQDNPDYPAVIAPLPDDIPSMAALGFNVVRLLIHWSALEPLPGLYDELYLDRIAEQLRDFEAHDIYVVLDMHQDAWGKHIASREADETCLPPMEPSIGWDGAPQWATITDGLSTCRLSQRELSPAVSQAFANFYLDRNGIQSAFIAAWQHVVKRFADTPAIAGYDIFNEPHTSYAVGLSGSALLGSFYGQAIDAIRQAEQSVPGGFPHIVFFEPTVLWSLSGFDAVPPPSFTADSNIVFAPHLYCGAIGPTPPAFCFEAANQAAALLGTTVWVGEWAGWLDSPDMLAHREEYAALEDANLIGGAVWQWSQGCWEPHSIATPENTPPQETIHVARIGCPNDDYRGVVEINRPLYSRPYPRAAPGLQSLASDPASHSATISGDEGGIADLWVANRYAGEPSITGTGITDVSTTPVSGGYRVQVEV
ncbi:MAG: glycoside hydrolase family 5 protein, partial [Oceanococcus sp.]